MIANSKQTNHIQLLRGLAIIAVVLIHNIPAGLLQVYVRPFLNFAVGLFLFLSGFLSNNQKWKSSKRIKKIIIPYVVWTLIYSVINNITDLPTVPVSFLKNLITSKSAPMMYFVFVYCQLTLLIPLIDKLAKSKYKYLGFAIAPAEIIFMRTIPLTTEWYEFNAGVEILMSVSCLGWFTYFYLGYLIGNNLISVRKTSKLWTILWCVAILFQFAEGYYQYSIGLKNCGTQLKLSALFTGVCFMMFAYNFINSDNEYKSKILKMLGDNSFGIYFSHMAAIMLISKIPFYSKVIIFPINAIIVVSIDLILIYVGKKILGKHSKYLAL